MQSIFKHTAELVMQLVEIQEKFTFYRFRSKLQAILFQEYCFLITINVNESITQCELSSRSE